MINASEHDFFKDNPINEFVGAGFHKYRPNWGWERKISNASFYFIAENGNYIRNGSLPPKGRRPAPGYTDTCIQSNIKYETYYHVRIIKSSVYRKKTVL